MSNNANRLNRKRSRGKANDLYRKYISVTCKRCGECFKIRAMSKNDANGCTFDCKYCGELLIMKDKRVRIFHEYMHELNKNWPCNGKGTYYIEV